VEDATTLSWSSAAVSEWVDAVDRKLSKLVRACRSYSLPKLAQFFFETQCITTILYCEFLALKWVWCNVFASGNWGVVRQTKGFQAASCWPWAQFYNRIKLQSEEWKGIFVSCLVLYLGMFESCISIFSSISVTSFVCWQNCLIFSFQLWNM